jgi:tetratricopeptide (TPR) repeat protein
MIQTRVHQNLLLLTVALLLCACTGAESRKASFIAQGQRHMAEHEWQKARLDFGNALQIDPKDQKLQLLLAQLAERTGEFNEAAGRYRALLDRDPGNVVARAALGRLYAGGGLTNEAISLAQEGLATRPEDPSLLTARGAARAMRGDTVGALQDAEAALARTPTDADTATLTASLYQRQGRNDEALAVLLKASVALPDNIGLHVIAAQALVVAGRDLEAEQQLLEVVRLEPKVQKHRYRLAQFYVLQKNIDAAERTLRAAIAAAPDDVEPKLALANLIAAQRSFETGEKSLKQLVASDPGNLALQMGLGEYYETHQRPVLAAAVYRQVITAGGTKAQGLGARNRLAAMALAANRSAEASGLIDEILKVSPHDNEALTMRANVALARGDSTGAIADLRLVLRDQPNTAAILRALAAAYLANRDVALAEETLRAAIQTSPTDIPTRLALADLLMKSGRGNEAQPLADHLVSDQPGDVRALEAAFRVQLQRRDLKAARKTAEEMQSLRPDLAAGNYFTGLVNEAENKPDAARKSFEQASEQAPGAVEPLAAAARIDFAQRQELRALARVERALAGSPDSSALLGLKAEILAQLKRYDESADSANRAITRAPAWWVAYDDLARAEVGRNRTEAAIAAYMRGIEATQSAPLLVLQLTSLLERVGRVDDAVALYETWLQREPGSELASNNLAMLLLTHKAADQVAQDRALALARRLEHSTQPEFLDTLGWVHFQRGEFALAVDVLQRAVMAAPDTPVIRAHLGLAQFRLGRRSDARETLQRALATSASYPEAVEARAALAKLKIDRP